ncbi:hypothetical protein AMTR_s00010p00220070 [Amborella trichopoda]|uniref:Disease resistance R13L4/SHOC-2-like LRR domain-containing protein n=1 Tax=Amborella trichopoda TaxID=13333 RepID=W1NGH7_AMBTC|nr:hypothetical protein AMTR_s00010p00220070 [Amborella trichopoda]
MEMLSREIGELIHLKNLSLQFVNMDIVEELWASIHKMTDLQSLDMVSMDYEAPIPIEVISCSPPHPIPHLHINAVLERLPQWLCSQESIRQLHLISYLLTEDPLEALQYLPNLVELVLYRTCNGRKIGDEGTRGFPKLMKLTLSYLDELEWLGGSEGIYAISANS